MVLIEFYHVIFEPHLFAGEQLLQVVPRFRAIISGFLPCGSMHLRSIQADQPDLEAIGRTIVGPEGVAVHHPFDRHKGAVILPVQGAA